MNDLQIVQYFFEFIKNSGNIGHIPKDIRYLFEYAEYGYFIEYLVVNYGSDTFFKFIHQYIREPELEEELLNKYIILNYWMYSESSKAK